MVWLLNLWGQIFMDFLSMTSYEVLDAWCLMYAAPGFQILEYQPFIILVCIIKSRPFEQIFISK